MTDLAEAVIRGDILVDEIDFIEAIEKGRLSRSDGARFSAVLEQHSKLNKKSSNSYEECLKPVQDASSKPINWDEVLVDEIDFIEALKTGRINKDDCHITSINKETFEDSSGDIEEAKISFHDDILTDDEKTSEASSSDILI